MRCHGHAALIAALVSVRLVGSGGGSGRPTETLPLARLTPPASLQHGQPFRMVGPCLWTTSSAPAARISRSLLVVEADPRACEAWQPPGIPDRGLSYVAARIQRGIGAPCADGRGTGGRCRACVATVEGHPGNEHAGRVKPIDFELERAIRAPIDEVFSRLVDIDGHNSWLAHTGSMLKHPHQTSPGEPTVGTTFIDETSQGPMPGEIVALEAPHTIVFHWWEKSKSGKLKFEGWPSYHLQAVGDNEAVVRHRGKLMSYGAWRLGTPLWRRLAVKERTITVDALKASSEDPRPR